MILKIVINFFLIFGHVKMKLEFGIIEPSSTFCKNIFKLFVDLDSNPYV